MAEGTDLTPEGREVVANRIARGEPIELAERPVEELIELIDDQALTAEELAAANEALEAGLAELTPADALADIQSYLECFDDSARTRSLRASLAVLARAIGTHCIEHDSEREPGEPRCAANTSAIDGDSVLLTACRFGS